MNLYVADIFKSIQGEGPKAGTPSLFLRLGICNLQCKWCDTPYTWKKGYTDYKKKSDEEIIARLIALKGNSSISNLVITGGEPLLQQQQIAELLKKLFKLPKLKKFEIEFETNGSLKLMPALIAILNQRGHKISFNISPKLADSGNKPLFKNNLGLIYKPNIYPNSILKFVYVNKKSEKLINKFLKYYQNVSRGKTQYIPVYIMPEGTNVKSLQKNQQKILQYCAKNGFIYTPRLQIHLFGNKRAT